MYSFAFLAASSLAHVSISLINFAVSSFTSSSTDCNNNSFACSEVNPEILSSSCVLCSLSFSTSALTFTSCSSLVTKAPSFFSSCSAFLSTASSFARTRFSYLCNSALRSFVSFSSSFLVFKDSSFA